MQKKNPRVASLGYVGLGPIPPRKANEVQRYIQVQVNKLAPNSRRQMRPYNSEMRPKETKDKKALVVAQEIKIARLLANNDKRVRDKVLKRLNKWLTVRSQSSFGKSTSNASSKCYNFIEITILCFHLFPKWLRD